VNEASKNLEPAKLKISSWGSQGQNSLQLYAPEYTIQDAGVIQALVPEEKIRTSQLLPLVNYAIHRGT